MAQCPLVITGGRFPVSLVVKRFSSLFFVYRIDLIIQSKAIGNISSAVIDMLPL